MADIARARAKNSAKQRRHYHRKQELTKTTLPAEKAALEQQLAALFAGTSRLNSAALAKQKLLMLGDDEFPCARRLSREGKLTEIHRLKLLQVVLLDQKRAKELQLHKMQEQQCAIQSLLASEQLLRKCEFLRVRSLIEIFQLRRSWRFAPSARSSALHGWQETRVVENDTFRWSMQKVVKMRCPRVLALKTWKICANPERWVKLFSTDTEVRCRVVEHVDASNVLMLQQYRDRERGGERSGYEGWKKTLVLVTCATTDAGAFVVIVRGMPSDRVFAPMEGEAQDDTLSRDNVWTDLFCSVEIEAVEDSPGDARCTFSGVMPTLRCRSTEQLWLREAVTLAVNWEAAVAVDARESQWGGGAGEA